MPSTSQLTSTLLPILSSLTHLTAASPVLVNEIVARDEWQPTAGTLTCLYLTTEPNWGGEGINLCEVGGTCSSQLPNGLAGNVSSAGPEEGVTCFLFSEEDCQGDRSASLVNPGYADLDTVGFAKKARSWECWKWDGWMGTSSASSTGSDASSTTSGGSESMGIEASTVSHSSSPEISPRLVSITTTIGVSDAADAQTATSAPGLPLVSSSIAPTMTASSSQAQIFETSMTIVVFTHTYADGSKETITSPLAVPVALTSAAANAGGAVSITATEVEATLEGPTPFQTPSATESEMLEGPSPLTTSSIASGVRITTTLSVTDSTASSTSSAQGVEITTTQGVPSPVPTLTNEGVTVPVPTEVSPSSVSPSSPPSTLSTLSTSSSMSSSTEEGPQGWTSLVTLTGVDATLTVTVTGGPAASSTS